MTDCPHPERIITAVTWLPCYPWPGGEGPERSVVRWVCLACGHEGEAVKEGEANAWRWAFMEKLRSGAVVRAKQPTGTA